MRKVSSGRGEMELTAYASGDGAISFIWRNSDCHSKTSFYESVTLQDVQEYMANPENKEKWKGWNVVVLNGKKFPEIKLAKLVSRLDKTRLFLDGKEYEYKAFEDMRLENRGVYAITNTMFYIANGHTDIKTPLESAVLISAMCFFLNHEKELGRKEDK